MPAGRLIPAAVGTTAGTCTVTVHVTAPSAGSFTNIVGVNALQTSIGNNAAPALPTRSESMRAALSTRFGVAAMRRQAM